MSNTNEVFGPFGIYWFNGGSFDPAYRSGNFLYVALRSLLDLWNEGGRGEKWWSPQIPPLRCASVGMTK